VYRDVSSVTRAHPPRGFFFKVMRSVFVTIVTDHAIVAHKSEVHGFQTTNFIYWNQFCQSVKALSVETNFSYESTSSGVFSLSSEPEAARGGAS